MFLAFFFNFILSIILVPLFTCKWKDKQNRWGAFLLSILGMTPFLAVPFIWLICHVHGIRK